jgi:hypothetical protein
MRERVTFTVEEAMPGREAVLEQMGMARPAEVSARSGALLEAAGEELTRMAEPVGLVDDVSTPEFEAVYRGEGLNSHDTPLAQIYPRAAGLALFAATLGEPVSARIRELFAANDAARGFVLDAVASVSADRLAGLLAERIRWRASEAAITVVAYSPGYCGWHISAQRALFARLRPGEIGISLNDSYLMRPLKSVSGVLVSGSGRIHRFRGEYSFCEACATRQCLPRMASVRGIP